MEAKTKKRLLIGGSLLVIAGVVGYLLYKRNKDKKTSQETPPPQPDTGTGGGGSSSSTTPSNTSTSTSGNPIGTTDDVKKFQDWMDAKHPNWVKGQNLNKGGGYGSFGPSTKKAWESYGDEYTKATTTLSPEQIAAQKDKAYKDAWAAAKKAGAPTFVFEGRPYDTATGKVYLDPAVIRVGDTVYATDKVSGYTGSGLVTAFSWGGTSFGNFYKNQKVGKVVAIDNTFKSLKVENLEKPMTADGKYFTSFFVPQAKVTKIKPANIVP